MIRLIEEKDIQSCLDIYNWYIDQTTITFETKQLTLHQFTDRVHAVCQKYPWIVLEEDSAIKGYAYLGTFNEREAYDWSADVSIYLSQKERGKGYGKALMEELIRIAKMNGYRKLISLITMGNYTSEKIHEKFGFVKKAELEDTGYKHGKWLGVSFYMLDLPFDTQQEPVKPKNLNPYTGEK